MRCEYFPSERYIPHGEIIRHIPWVQCIARANEGYLLFDSFNAFMRWKRGELRDTIIPSV